ncbi:hypothetical protein GCM10009798_32560 [Nocardioides panacihumi]|uniref:O-antigen ligase-related domain-containing protein n=1 Tax=Nocardioides panacihumi TaxID=400774 RepID=A0ABN2RI28_9ACTN
MGGTKTGAVALSVLPLGPAQRIRRRIDGVSLLTCYLVVLLAIPSRLSFAPLGGAGSPAVVVGLMGFGTWSYFHVMRNRPWGQGRQPVRTALFCLLFCFAISYVGAMNRAIDPDESSSAQLSMVVLLSWCGAMVLANDGIPDRARFETLLRRVVYGAGALAALGLIQFVTGRTWVDMVSIPGLTANQALSTLTSREGFHRPAGTAIHPIEFGAVLTMALPIAVNLAIADKSRDFVLRWAPPLVIAMSIVVSISRSAVICAVVGLLLLVPSWTRSMRWGALACSIGFVGFVYVMIPGLIETIVRLFTGIGQDSSAASRVDSYALAGEFIARSPIYGRGFGTFLPKYRILDNQYLGLLIEVGALGLIAMLSLVITAMVCSRLVVGTTSDERVKLTGQAMFASVAAGGVGLAFYDGLGFPMAAGFLFLVLGIAGAQWRIARREPGFSDPRARSLRASRRRRHATSTDA